MDEGIPKEQWRKIAAVPHTGADMVRVMDLLRTSPHPWVEMLGGLGVKVATQVNLYGFEENMGQAGKIFDESKQDGNWLGAEALSLKENGFTNHY